MTRALLRGAYMDRVILTKANLHLANLSGAYLSGALLSGSNLKGADLKGANLRGVTANNLINCPKSLPSGWVCEDNSLIQR